MNRFSLKHVNSKRLWLLWALIFFALAPLAAHSAPDDTQRYRSDLGAASPALDIYSFRGAKNAPVMIYVHGGGWQIGRKSQVQAKPAFFNKLGFIFVSVEYRMVPDVRVEDQLQDIDRAIGWVAANIAAYGGDAGNISLMGHSAGAHLVTMAAVAPQKNARALLRTGALKAVISNDTRAYDIPRIAAGARGGKLPKLYATVFGANQNRWRALSPLYQVGKAPLPDFLILYSGAGNDAVRRSFAEDFAATLTSKGGRATLFDGRRYSHAQINRQMGKNNAISLAVQAFLRQTAR
jgi:acetyl esterase/lipase